MPAKADPAYSAGARYERKSFRNKLRRLLVKNPDNVGLSVLLDWVEDRQVRYDKKPGGLGK